MFSLRYLGLSQLVNTFIFKHLKPYLGESTTVKSVNLRLTGLILHGLEYSPEADNVTVGIDEIRLVWNPLNLLVYGFKGVNLIDEISLSEARISYFPHLDSLKRKKKKVHYDDLWNLPLKYPSVKKVTLKDGLISTPYCSARQLNFWLDLSAKHSAEYDLSAAVAAEYANLRLRGSARLNNKVSEAEINLFSFPLDSLTRLPPKLLALKGVFSLDTKVLLQDELFTLDGSAVIDSLLLSYGKNYRYYSPQAKLSFLNQEILCDTKGALSGIPVSLQGRLIGFDQPDLEMQIVSGVFDLADIADRFAPSLPLAGNARLNAQLKAAGGKSYLNFSLKSPLAVYDSHAIEDFQAAGAYANERITLAGTTFKALGGQVQARGEVSTKRYPPQVNLDISYNGLPDVQSIYKKAERLPLDSLCLQGKLTGTTANPNFTAEYKLFPGYGISTLTGDLEYADNSLKLREFSGAGDSILAEIHFQHHVPLFSLSAFNLHKVLPPDKLPPRIHWKDTQLELFAGGALDKFDLFIGADMPDFALNIDAGIKLSAGVVDLSGYYRLFLQDTLQTGGEFDLRYAQDTLTIDNFTAGAELYLTGEVDLKNRHLIDCQLRTDDFPLDTLLLYLGEKRWQEFGGLLKLEINANGSWNRPQMEFSAYAAEGRLYNSPGYWANLAGNLSGNYLKLTGIDFGNRGSILIAGRGSCNLDSKELDFRASLDKVDFDLLLNSLIGKPGVVNGIGGYTIHLGGSWDKPVLEAGLRIGQGALKGVRFDRFTGAVKFDAGKSGGKTIEIPSLLLTKDGKYTISSQGTLPLEGGEIHLDLLAEGNLLAILTGMTKTITRAEGYGKISISAAGAYDSLRVTSAQAWLKNGLLEMSSIVNKIQNINLSAELENNFIHITGLSGIIDNVPFTIKTVPEMSTVQGKVPPLILGNSGLSLGIITVETGREGLKLSLPAIVSPGETAKLNVIGRVEGEKALIAGPVDRPLVRAKVIVRDGVIAFPPPKKPYDHNRQLKPITKFIYRINWDLEIIPDRGNTYERDMSGVAGSQILKDISGLFSRMTVDLDIDRRLEGMTMKGAIKNDSSFTISGGFVSSKGTINLLDMDFKVQQFKLEFGAEGNIPWLEGYATTTEKDSLGRDQTIILRLVNIDPVTGEKSNRARWGDFTFVLENEAGDSQEQILTALGYAPESLTDKATALPLNAVDKAVFGNWLNRLEREIKNVLGVDYINIDPALAQNLLAEQFASAPADSALIDWRTRYLRHSRFSVGKYITDDLFFTYTGSFEAGESALDHREKLGIIHVWQLEFRLPAAGANLLMVLGYEYDNLEEKDDKSVSIRYTFNF